jgi:hypothetical protein
MVEIKVIPMSLAAQSDGLRALKVRSSELRRLTACATFYKETRNET